MHMTDRLRLAFDVCILIGGAEMESYPRRRLAALVDGNILVVGRGRTRRRAAEAMAGRVQAAGGRFFGMVWTEGRQVA